MAYMVSDWDILSIYAKNPIHFWWIYLKIECFIPNQKYDNDFLNNKAGKSAFEADKDSLHEKKAKKTCDNLAMGMRWILDGGRCSAQRHRGALRGYGYGCTYR